MQYGAPLESAARLTWGLAATEVRNNGPRIILGIHPRLHLLVINHTHSERLLHLGLIESGAGLLNFS
jgi:hypothetical protein